MQENGTRHQIDPRIEIRVAADPTEAAAVVAAMEQFLADTTPVAERGCSDNPWQRAALLEGVSSKRPFDRDRRDRWQ